MSLAVACHKYGTCLASPDAGALLASAFVLLCAYAHYLQKNYRMGGKRELLAQCRMLDKLRCSAPMRHL